MTQEEIAYNTKQMLAAALKKLMGQKPLQKITITELAAECDVNRKTFYYHFQDINDLLKWMLEQEVVEVVRQFDLVADFQEALQFVVDYVEQNAHLLNCAYDYLGRDGLKRFLYADLIFLVESMVLEYETELSITLPENYRKMLTALLAEGIAGILIEWFREPKQYNKEEMVRSVSSIVHAIVPAAVRAGGET